MERIVVFILLQLLASGYAVLRGGAPERIAGLALLSAAVATRFMHRGGAGLDLGVLSVDLLLLGVLVVVALFADRHWPLLLAALQALGTGAHLVKALDDGVLRLVYAILAASWSYPMLFVLVIGTFRHRSRLARIGADPGWSRGGSTRA